MRHRNLHEHHLLTNFQLPSSHLEMKDADGWLWVGHLESPLSHLTFCAKIGADIVNLTHDQWYICYVPTHAFRYIKYTFTNICDRFWLKFGYQFWNHRILFVCSISRILTCWANFKLKSPVVKFLGCIYLHFIPGGDVYDAPFFLNHPGRLPPNFLQL